MGVFYLKRGDTRPVLEPTLKNPDGSIHDLTGATSVTLHVLKNDGTTMSRAMTMDADRATGKVSYTWVDADWDTSNVNGFLIETPTPPLKPSEKLHRMEYEVLGGGGARETFPNGGYDEMVAIPDIGQA